MRLILRLTKFITSDRLSGCRGGAGCRLFRYQHQLQHHSIACIVQVNNVGVQPGVELNGDGGGQHDPGVRPPTAPLPG